MLPNSAIQEYCLWSIYAAYSALLGKSPPAGKKLVEVFSLFWAILLWQQIFHYAGQISFGKLVIKICSQGKISFGSNRIRYRSNSCIFYLGNSPLASGSWTYWTSQHICHTKTSCCSLQLASYCDLISSSPRSKLDHKSSRAE